MNKLNFTEEDKQKTIEFLNMVATNATFKFKTDDVIKYFGLLAHMQQTILPKLDANIFEIKKVIESKKETKKDKKK